MLTPAHLAGMPSDIDPHTLVPIGNRGLTPPQTQGLVPAATLTSTPLTTPQVFGFPTRGTHAFILLQEQRFVPQTPANMWHWGLQQFSFSFLLATPPYFIFKYLILLYMHTCLACICMYIICQNSLELELQTVVSYHVGTGN